MISVCMATYNGSKFIREQIASILPQLSADDELIISDDHSTDDTLRIVQEFTDNRIKIIFNTKAKGYTNNFENAIENASGDYIYLSDQDDVWKPDKVAVYQEYFKTYDFVVSNAQIVDENLNTLSPPTYFDLRGKSTGFFSDLVKAKSLGCCMAFRKEVLKKILPFPADKVLCPHDFWILLVSEFYYKFKIIDEPLVLYRRHGKATSSGGKISHNSPIFMLKFRFYCLLMVLGRLLK